MDVNPAALAALAAALALGATACGGDADGAAPPLTTETTVAPPPPPPPPPPPSRPRATTVTIVVEGGRPRGGIARPTVGRGERVVLVVRSDIADEVHVHGYDLSASVTAGGTARIELVADVPGRFEVELEERGVQVADLTVEP